MADQQSPGGPGPDGEWPEDSIDAPPAGMDRDGSFFLGVAAGFWLGPIGVGLAYLLGKGKETRRGAWAGLAGFSVVFGLLYRLGIVTRPEGHLLPH